MSAMNLDNVKPDIIVSEADEHLRAGGVLMAIGALSGMMDPWF